MQKDIFALIIIFKLYIFKLLFKKKKTKRNNSIELVVTKLYNNSF